MQSIFEKLRKFSPAQITAAFAVLIFAMGSVLSAFGAGERIIRETENISLQTDHYKFESVSPEAADKGDYYFALSKDSSVTAKVTGVKGNEKSDPNHDDTAHAQFDLVVVPKNYGTAAEGITVSGITGTYDTSVSGARVYRDVDLAFGNSMNVTITTDVDAYVYVFRAYTDTYNDKTVHHNAYVTSFFELQMLMDEPRHNTENNTADYDVSQSTLNYKPVESYRNIYLLNDITVKDNIDSEKIFFVNIPCAVNLLHRNIILANALTVKHDYSGAFAIDTISGKFNNESKPFTIKTPLAYYHTSTNICTNEDNFIKNDAEYGDYTDQIISDAKAYVQSRIPKFTFEDISLPKEYHHYGVEFSYTSDSATVFSSKGKVNRQEDNKEVTVTCAFDYAGKTNTVDVKTTVVGTAKAALEKTLSAETSEYIGRSINDDGCLKNAVDVKLLFDSFASDSRTAGSYVFTFDKAGLYFDVAYYEESNIVTEKNILSMTLTTDKNGSYSVSWNDGGKDVTKQASEFDTVILRFSNYTAQNAQVNILINDANKTLVKLKGLSPEERTAEIKTKRSSLYYNSLGEQKPILWVSGNAICSGEDIVIPSDMNIKEMTYELRVYKAEDLETDGTPKNNATSDDAIMGVLLLGEKGSNSYFYIENGKLVINKSLSLSAGQALVFVSNIEYNDDADKTYQLYQRVIIPSAGVGTGGDSMLVEEGNYAKIFGKEYYTQDITGLESSRGMKLKVVFTSQNGVALPNDTTEIKDGENVFCSVDNGNDTPPVLSPKIKIDMSKVPAENTLVGVTLYFYLPDDQSLTVQYSRDYTFLIPGVYRLKDHIADPDIYIAMLEQCGSPVDSEGKTLAEGYLLVDKVKAFSGDFNGSLEYINGSHTVTLDTLKELNIPNSNGTFDTSSRDLTGIQYMVNASRFTFDGSKVGKIPEFTENMAASSLSMKNCSLSSKTDGLKDLSGLKNLTSADLSNNSISDLTGCLYRTVIDLNIDNNLTFESVKSVADTLPQLKTLSVKSCKVKDFRPLTDIGTLKTVYLSGNNCDGKPDGDTQDLYGTHGLINVCNYVALIDNGVDVYPTDENKAEYLNDNNTTSHILDDNGYQIKSGERYLGVTVNSLMFMEKYTTEDAAEKDILNKVKMLYKYQSSTEYSVQQIEKTQNGNKYTYIIKISGMDKDSHDDKTNEEGLSVYRLIETEIG